MKTLLASAAIIVATSTGAFAASSALDVYEPVKNEVAIDYTATASIGIDNALVERERLGDGSPSYGDADVTVDYTVTSSLGTDFLIEDDRLGDGSPQYK